MILQTYCGYLWVSMVTVKHTRGNGHRNESRRVTDGRCGAWTYARTTKRKQQKQDLVGRGKDGNLSHGCSHEACYEGKKPKQKQSKGGATKK